MFKSFKKLALTWAADSLKLSLPTREHQSDPVLLIIELNRDTWKNKNNTWKIPGNIWNLCSKN